MFKKIIIPVFLALMLVCSCRKNGETDTLVSAAVRINVDNVLTSSAEVTVSSRQDKVVSCLISSPEKYEDVAPYLDMDAVAKYNYIKGNSVSAELVPVLFRNLEPRSRYFVGTMGLDADGNVITAPVFTVFETVSMELVLKAEYTGRTDSGLYGFSAAITPDVSTEEYKYVFGGSLLDFGQDELLEYLISNGKTATGEISITAEDESKKVMLAAVPFDMDGNMGDVVSLIVAGEMTLVTVDLDKTYTLQPVQDNDNIFEGVVSVPAGDKEFSITVNGVQYGAMPWSGTAGIGTCTGRESIAYPAVNINNDQVTYTVSKSTGRMSPLADGGKKFWTSVPQATAMLVRVDLSYGDGIPRYYFRETEPENVVFHESFDLFAYSGDYMKPANGCAVEMAPDAVDGTEPGIMQRWDLTNNKGANKNLIGYNNTCYDYPEKKYGSVVADGLYMKNRDMDGWTIESCGERVGAIQLSVSGTHTFGILATPCLAGLAENSNVTIEIDMARFSSSSKNGIAIRLAGGGAFVSGEVKVDGKKKVDITSDVASKTEYLVGYSADICPPTKENSTLDKPVSHFRFSAKGCGASTRIIIDSSVDANAKGDNAGASRCFVFDLKVTR